MLAPLLGLSLLACTPIGAAVADRAESALPKPTARALTDKEAEQRLGALRNKGTQLMRQPLDREHYRSSAAAALDDYAALAEAYLLLLPRLSPARALTALTQLVEVTSWVEHHIDVGPPDWPEGTWADYRAALGCQSFGRPLIELGLRYAAEHDLKGADRRRLESALHDLEHETIDF